MFDESKHPRADDGKFTAGSGTKRGGVYPQYTHSDLDQALNALDKVDKKTAKTKINLSKQEWALFYERIGKIKKEGHSVRKMKNGNMLIPIETEGGNVLITASGSYQAPKVEFTVRFESNDEMYKILEKLENI